jgi:hypothetical protein
VVVFDLLQTGKVGKKLLLISGLARGKVGPLARPHSFIVLRDDPII